MRWTYGFVTSLVFLATFSGVACSNLSDDCDINSRCTDTPGGTHAGASTEAGQSSGGTSSGNGGMNGTSGKAGSGSGGGGSSSVGGAGGEGGAGGMSGDCDTTKSPTEEACLVADEYAVFVSPDGDDDKNDGSQGSPLASLTKAVEIAEGTKLVLVCDATYDEHVVVGAAAHVYGGFRCTDWAAEIGKPLFKPTTAGPALKIDSVDDEVLIQAVSFEVGDPLGAGETALAAIVNASPKVTLRGVSLKAGKGKAGTHGSLTPFNAPDASTLNGNPESAQTPGTGGGEKICQCQTPLTSIGGVGGTPSSTGQSGAKGGPSHGPAGGEGGDPAAGDCGNGSSGKKGANAAATAPASGASALGIAAVTGWQPTPGSDGATGQPGQGGGGGASLNASGHGGGGGCGGCGGNGGTAGKGGGGSIALLALASPVMLEASTLVTADAGNGGAGAAGQVAKTDIGAGGSVVSSINSCPGGNGGKGGDGGAGGGGAGGISVGVVWKGAMQPTVSPDTMIMNGKAGSKGAGGVPGTNDGIAGVAQKSLSLN